MPRADGVTGDGEDQPLVKAAGGLVWRRHHDVVKLLLVHRPKYDDWSFPKGKLDDDETFREAARREVEEETGFRCTLGPELDSVSYTDGKGRPKIVRYWAMTVDDGEFAPNEEVDELRWVATGEVGPRLTYAHDLDVLESFEQISGSFTEK